MKELTILLLCSAEPKADKPSEDGTTEKSEEVKEGVCVCGVCVCVWVCVCVCGCVCVYAVVFLMLNTVCMRACVCVCVGVCVRCVCGWMS